MRVNCLKKYFDIHKTVFSIPFFKLQKQNFSLAAALSATYNLITYKWAETIVQNGLHVYMKIWFDDSGTLF